MSSRITGETSTDEILRRSAAASAPRSTSTTSAPRSSTPTPASLVPRGDRRLAASRRCARVRARPSPRSSRSSTPSSSARAASCSRTTQAHSRLARDVDVYPSQLNGHAARGRGTGTGCSCRSRDGEGALLGVIWVDNPRDRLVPSADRLQALRIFANDAAAALVSGKHLGELRFLADHDPLTRLLNRRAFVHAARRGGRARDAVRARRSVSSSPISTASSIATTTSVTPPATRPSSRFAGILPARCGGRTTRSASAATSSRSSSPRRRRTDARLVVDRDPGDARQARLPAARSPALARPHGELRLRPVPEDAKTRRRCSASPTRRCTRRSGTARCCASSRAPSSLTIRPCVGSTEHGKERRRRLSRRRSEQCRR